MKTGFILKTFTITIFTRLLEQRLVGSDQDNVSEWSNMSICRKFFSELAL